MNIKTLATSLVALGAVVLLTTTLQRSCSKGRFASANSDLDRVVASRLGQEVAGNQEAGQVVFIRMTGFITATEKVQKTQTKAFKQGLDGGGWDVVEFPPESLSEGDHQMWALRTAEGNWGDDLVNWISPYPDAVAIVSMEGVPRLSPQQMDGLPPMYAHVGMIHDYEQQMVKSGHVAGLAVMRDDADPGAIRTFRGSSEELFDMAYEYTASDGN